MICFRLLDSDDPAEPLAQAVAKVCEGENPSDVYSVNPTSFRQVPNAPFAYWVSEHVRKLFITIKHFNCSTDRLACITNEVSDDNRYYRSTWEIPISLIGRHHKWAPLSIGGKYSPFYAEKHLVVDWDDIRETYKGCIGTKNRPLARPASVNNFSDLA